MSIWIRIGEFLSNTTNDALSSIVESVRTFFEGDPLTRKRVSFSIALIGLSAKMAKADGIVTQDEVSAFYELFNVPQNQVHNVARLYDLAKQDTAGFDYYARDVKRLFPDDEDILTDVLDGMFHISKADGFVHEAELSYIAIVAGIFGLGDKAFEQIKLRHVISKEGDPYIVLGAKRDWDDEAVKKQFRKMVNDNHPDKMIARGVPPEFLKIANDRLVKINLAWDAITRERGI